MKMRESSKRHSLAVITLSYCVALFSVALVVVKNRRLWELQVYNTILCIDLSRSPPGTNSSDDRYIYIYIYIYIFIYLFVYLFIYLFIYLFMLHVGSPCDFPFAAPRIYM